MRDYQLYFLAAVDDGKPQISGVASAPFETDEEALAWAEARSGAAASVLWSGPAMLKRWGAATGDADA